VRSPVLTHMDCFFASFRACVIPPAGRLTSTNASGPPVSGAWSRERIQCIRQHCIRPRQLFRPPWGCQASELCKQLVDGADPLETQGFCRPNREQPLLCPPVRQSLGRDARRSARAGRIERPFVGRGEFA